MKARKPCPLAARIKRLMQSDDDVGKIAQATPVLLARAMELFLQRLCEKTAGVAQSRQAKTVTASHLKHCVEHEETLDFLKEVVVSAPDLQAEDAKPKRKRPSAAAGEAAVDGAADGDALPRTKKPPRARKSDQTGTAEDAPTGVVGEGAVAVVAGVTKVSRGRCGGAVAVAADGAGGDSDDGGTASVGKRRRGGSQRVAAPKGGEGRPLGGSERASSGGGAVEPAAGWPTPVGTPPHMAAGMAGALDPSVMLRRSPPAMLVALPLLPSDLRVQHSGDAGAVTFEITAGDWRPPPDQPAILPGVLLPAQLMPMGGSGGAAAAPQPIPGAPSPALAPAQPADALQQPPPPPVQQQQQQHAPQQHAPHPAAPAPVPVTTGKGGLAGRVAAINASCKAPTATKSAASPTATTDAAIVKKEPPKLGSSSPFLGGGGGGGLTSSLRSSHPLALRRPTPKKPSVTAVSSVTTAPSAAAAAHSSDGGTPPSPTEQTAAQAQEQAVVAVAALQPPQEQDLVAAAAAAARLSGVRVAAAPTAADQQLPAGASLRAPPAGGAPAPEEAKQLPDAANTAVPALPPTAHLAHMAVAQAFDDDYDNL